MDMMKMIPICAFLAVTCGCMVFSFGALEEETCSYQGIDTVEVKGEFLAVDVTAEDSSEVVMTTALPDESVNGSRHFTVRQQVAGSKLTVWVEKDPGVMTIIGGGRLSLGVPRSAAVSVETVSGSASVDGLQTAALRVVTVSGAASVTGASAALAASTVSGSLTVNDFEGTLSARTVSGAIECQGIKLNADSSLSTTSGAISVHFTGGLDDYTFDLSSVSGSLVVGNIRAGKGLRMGTGPVSVHGVTVSGAQVYR
jgi:hypothetical protein